MEKVFKAKVLVQGEVQEVPVYAETIEEALEVADKEYGEDNVLRLRQEVTQ